jgi:hypothetical protein
MVKFGGGFYCGLIDDVPGEGNIMMGNYCRVMMASYYGVMMGEDSIQTA